MAGRGPAPTKDRSERVRPGSSVAKTVVVSGDGEVRGPDLPGSFDWPAQTQAWWETWRSSPQATTFSDTDWGFLLDTALLHAELWAGNGAVAAELRLRVAKFGATPEDRMRLRMSIEDPKPAGTKRTARKYSHLSAVGE